MSALIEDYTNTRKINLVKGSGARKEIKPLFGKIGPSFKDKATAVANELKGQDADKVEQEIAKLGYFSLHTDSGMFNIKSEHFTTVEKKGTDDVTAFKYGLVSIDATQTEEMKEELFAREVGRRIQMMRKDLGFTRVSKSWSMFIRNRQLRS